MNVKVYSTPGCPWCKVAKDFLESHHINFEYIDVSVDENAAKTMIKKSGQMGVPVIEIDDQIVIGFNKQVIEELLGISEPNNE